MYIVTFNLDFIRVRGVFSWQTDRNILPPPRSPTVTASYTKDHLFLKGAAQRHKNGAWWVSPRPAARTEDVWSDLSRAGADGGYQSDLESVNRRVVMEPVRWPNRLTGKKTHTHPEYVYTIRGLGLRAGNLPPPSQVNKAALPPPAAAGGIIGRVTLLPTTLINNGDNGPWTVSSCDWETQTRSAQMLADPGSSPRPLRAPGSVYPRRLDATALSCVTWCVSCPDKLLPWLKGNSGLKLPHQPAARVTFALRHRVASLASVVLGC